MCNWRGSLVHDGPIRTDSMTHLHAALCIRQVYGTQHGLIHGWDLRAQREVMVSSQLPVFILSVVSSVIISAAGLEAKSGPITGAAVLHGSWTWRVLPACRHFTWLHRIMVSMQLAFV